MSRRNFRTYTLALTADQEFNLRVAGNMYAVVDSVGEFTITFDESNRIQKAIAGTGGEFEDGYQDVKILSTTSQTVTVVLGFGKYVDARATVNATVNTTISPSDTFDNTADVTVSAAAVLLKAADTQTKEVMIHLSSAASNSIRVGGASVTVTTGIEVEPGMTLTIASEAAVYAIRAGAADVSVSTLKLTRA